MITKEQVKVLAKKYAIDEFTIMREYLQLVFLSHFYRKKEAKTVYFKGGTAIRLLFGSPRFSEDLDFSSKLNDKKLIVLMSQLEESINREVLGLTIKKWYKGKDTSRFRIKYLSKEFKYPVVIRLDFNRVQQKGEVLVSVLKTEFPIGGFPVISHLNKETILAEKMRALLCRSKGRDVFDLWFLLNKKGKWSLKKSDKKKLMNKITKISQNRIKSDLNRFLPKWQREIIGQLKEELINKLGED